MNNRKFFAVAALAAAVSMSAMTAEAARVGAATATPKAVTIKAAAPAAVSLGTSSTTTSATGSGRTGNGASSGMTRASALQQARAQSPSQQAPQAAAGNNNPSNYGSGSNGTFGSMTPTQQTPQQGYTGRQLAATAAAAAAGGYLLNSAVHQGQNAPVIVNAGNPGYNGGGYNGGGMAPAVVVAPASSGFGFGSFLFLVLLAAGGYFVYRRLTADGKSLFPAPAMAGAMAGAASSHSYSSATSAASSAGTSSMSADSRIRDSLYSGAVGMFRGTQDANNRRDRSAMSELVADEYLPTLTADFDTRAADSAPTKVHSAKVIGNIIGFERQDERYVGSVHFQADVSEGSGPSEEIEELWHFVRPLDNGSWKLAGIEQV